MSRPRRAETERLQQAREARNIVDEELKTMDVPKLSVAQNRAAGRLGISPKTLRRRLKDAPIDPPSEDVAAIDLSNLVIDCGEY